VLVAAALLAATGCGGDSPSAAPSGGAVPTVRVTERDFVITAPAELPSGAVDLAVANQGPDSHELIVVRTGDSVLPLRADNVTVDEEALEPVELGALEPGPPGSVRALHLRLTSGRYEMFCNMAGHYLGGMHRSFVVT
jgi:uncharacterized cupredoxin-like copper-binding protein